MKVSQVTRLKQQYRPHGRSIRLPAVTSKPPAFSRWSVHTPTSRRYRPPVVIWNFSFRDDFSMPAPDKDKARACNFIRGPCIEFAEISDIQPQARSSALRPRHACGFPRPVPASAMVSALCRHPIWANGNANATFIEIRFGDHLLRYCFHAVRLQRRCHADQSVVVEFILCGNGFSDQRTSRSRFACFAIALRGQDCRTLASSCSWRALTHGA